MRLIIVDGLDGVGKDTHAQLIKKRYEAKGERVLIRSHPQDDNFFGIKAKKALLGRGKINHLKASVFYMMDVLRSIKKYYGKKDYDTVIMVRYLMGTAYLPGRLARMAYDWFCNFVPTSDYMFFLDAPPRISLKRVRKRTEKEMFETYKELIRVRKVALSLAQGWHIIDTSKSKVEAFAHINKIIDELDSKIV
jgi:dTMP kinase